MAAVADNQLHRFMQGNERRVAAGKRPELLLNTGGIMKHPSCMSSIQPAVEFDRMTHRYPFAEPQLMCRPQKPR